MGRIEDILEKHSIALDRLSEKEARGILGSYRSSGKELAAALATGAGTDGQKQRRRVMLAQVKSGVAQLEERLGKQLDAGTVKASEKAVADLVGLVKVAEPELGEVAGLIEVEALSNLVGSQQLAIHRHSLRRYGLTMADRLQRDIVAGTIAGETVDQLEDRLGKSLGAMEHRAWLIARMELSRAYNDAAIESLKSTTILPGGMLKRIHETADKRNHPFSRASHGVVAKPDELFRVPVSAVMAAAVLLDKPAAGILWAQEGGNFVGQNLPAHFGERGRVVPWRKSWDGEAEEETVAAGDAEEKAARKAKAKAAAKAARKRHEEKEKAAGEKTTRKKAAPVVKPVKVKPVKPVKPVKVKPVKVKKVDPVKVALDELAAAEKAATNLGLNPHDYGPGGRRARIEALNNLGRTRTTTDALDRVSVAYRKAADVAGVAWEKAERKKWLGVMTDKLPRSGKAKVLAAMGEAFEFYPVNHLRTLAANRGKIKHSAAVQRAYADPATMSVHMDLRRLIGGGKDSMFLRTRAAKLGRAHDAKDTLVHEAGHVLDMMLGESRGAGNPWKSRPGFEDGPSLWARAYGKPYNAAKTGGIQTLPTDRGAYMWSGNWAHPYDARIYSRGRPGLKALERPGVAGPIEFVAMSNGRRAGSVARRLDLADVKGVGGPFDVKAHEARMRARGLDPRSAEDALSPRAPKVRPGAPLDGVAARLANTLDSKSMYGDGVSLRNKIYGLDHRDALEELYGDGQRFARSLAGQKDLAWAGDGDVHATALFIRQQYGTSLDRLLGPGGELAGKLSKPWNGKDWAPKLIPEHGPPGQERAGWATLLDDMVMKKKDLR